MLLLSPRFLQLWQAKTHLFLWLSVAPVAGSRSLIFAFSVSKLLLTCEERTVRVRTSMPCSPEVKLWHLHPDTELNLDCVFSYNGTKYKSTKKVFFIFLFLFQQIASAGSHKTHCKGHNIVQGVNRAIKVCAYFSSLTGSDWYSKCLTTLERIPTVRPFCWRVRSFV